jgi:hypothetical protein
MNTVLLASALALATAAAPTKTIDRTEPLAAGGSVTLETHNGTVVVHTWDRPEIEVHALIEAGGSGTADIRRFDNTTVEVTRSGDSVSIRTIYPEMASWWSWAGDAPIVRYTITAPRTARWTIRDHNAEVNVRDVHAAVTVDAHNGSVHASGLDGPLDVAAHNATVIAELEAFRGADVRTHNGSVELTLPSNAAFTLRTDTWRGDVRSDFPIAVNTWSGRRSRSLDAAVGGGGPTLRFTSHGGGLRLISRK